MLKIKSVTATDGMVYEINHYPYKRTEDTNVTATVASIVNDKYLTCHIELSDGGRIDLCSIRDIYWEDDGEPIPPSRV